MGRDGGTERWREVDMDAGEMEGGRSGGRGRFREGKMEERWRMREGVME